MSQVDDSPFLGLLGTAFLEHDSEVANKQTEAENVRRVEQVLMMLGSGNYDALGDLLADDVEMEIIGPAEAFMAGRHHGLPAVIEAVRNNFSLLEDQHPTVESVIAQGNQVVLVGREKGRIRSTGRSYDVSLVQIYTFREGRVVSMREVVDTATWMMASGQKL